MNTVLPPRRELPPEIKERMRPVFTEPRRKPAMEWIGAAAAAVLLVGGGMAATKLMAPDDQVSTGRVRVISPTDADLSRCRAALDDKGWRARKTFSLVGRKLLIGADGRYCELNRTTATVPKGSVTPLELNHGSVLFRTETIVVGVPPLGSATLTAFAGMNGGDTLVMPDLFVVDILGLSGGSLTLDFDTTDFKVPWTSLPGERDVKASFESGNGDFRLPENMLARCLDNALADEPETAVQNDWQHAASTSTEGDTVLFARRSTTGELGSCVVIGGLAGTFHKATGDLTPGSRGFTVVTAAPVRDRMIIAGMAAPNVGTIRLVSPEATGEAVTPVDGLFVARVNTHNPAQPVGINPVRPEEIRIEVRDRTGGLIYQGPPRP